MLRIIRNLLFIDMLKLVLLFVLVSYSPSDSAEELTLEVNAGTGQRTISPYIYGISLADDIEFYKSIKLPFDRMGGNAVTRYNWKNDMSNHASDWFFENLPEDNDHPEDLPDGSSADRFVEKDIEIGARTMMTIPLIGWIPKDRERRCGFSVEKYGPQEKTDENMPDCGNGVKSDGTPITDNDPTDTSVEIDSAFAQEWVQHLSKKYGNASDGGVLFYEMDNEYDLWQSTHRDVKPEATSGDDIIKLTQEYASTIKNVDPSSKVLGPVGWGYRSILLSGLDEQDENDNADKKAHGGLDFGQYYLEAMKKYEDKYNTRILDYFDCHIYPQQEGVWGDDSDEKTQALRLRSTRTLWDPTYVDESWIKDMGEPYSTVQFIPRMRKMVDDYYPDTKLAITEYNFGATATLNGALAQADVLGIFGREGVDLASFWRRWGPTDPSEPWAYAFRIYRNYDGKGSQFGDTSVSATSSDQEKITIFASTRSSDNKLIVLAINKDPSNAVNTSVKIEGFSPANSAKVFTYSDANLTQIVESSTELSGKTLPYNFPAYSITLFEIASK